jgi:hypothetical protein
MSPVRSRLRFSLMSSKRIVLTAWRILPCCARSKSLATRELPRISGEGRQSVLSKIAVYRLYILATHPCGGDLEQHSVLLDIGKGHVLKNERLVVTVHTCCPYNLTPPFADRTVARDRPQAAVLKRIVSDLPVTFPIINLLIPQCFRSL